jgi:hypothetical protein
VVLIIVVVILVLTTMLLTLVVASILLVWVVRIGIVVAPVSLLVLRLYFFDSKSSRFIIISITAGLLMSLLITTIMVVVLLILIIRIRIALLMAVAVIVMTLLRVSRHDCVLKESPAEMSDRTNPFVVVTTVDLMIRESKSTVLCDAFPTMAESNLLL